MTHALTLDSVTKRFGDFTAVDHLSMQIDSGTICAFLGQNGAGKTTTIRMIMSIFYPDEGTIEILGQPNAESLKDRLGYLPEEKGLYKKMRAGEILAYFGRLKGMPTALAKSRARDLLTRFGLGDSIDKRCEALSKGMGQKVQLLGTFIHDPELVILDEPFSGLDPINVDLMREVIMQMRKDGRTVIFSTHVMEQAEKLCDKVVMVHKGKKVIDGQLGAVKANAGGGVQIDYDGDGSILRQLAGVTRVNDSGKSAELSLEQGVDPQSILAQLVGRIIIRRFDLREASLHEIFKRTVEGAAS